MIWALSLIKQKPNNLLLRCSLEGGGDELGMGRVNFSPLGSGFRFFDYAWVGLRVFGFFFGLRNFGLGFTSSPSFFLNYTHLCFRKFSTSKSPPKNCLGQVKSWVGFWPDPSLRWTEKDKDFFSGEFFFPLFMKRSPVPTSHALSIVLF